MGYTDGLPRNSPTGCSATAINRLQLEARFSVSKVSSVLTEDSQTQQSYDIFKMNLSVSFPGLNPGSLKTGNIVFIEFKLFFGEKERYSNSTFHEQPHGHSACKRTEYSRYTSQSDMYVIYSQA